MAHTPLHGWKERDRKAEEAEEKKKKEKGRPIQKPPRKKKGKKGKGVDVAAMLADVGGAGLEEGEQEVMETAMAGPAQGNPMPSPKPPAWPTRPDGSRRLAKKGGVIRGYSSGKRVKASGKPRGVGLAKGIRKAKMVKMKG